MSKRKHPKDRLERRVLLEKKKEKSKYMKFDEFIKRVQENHEESHDDD